MNPSITTICRRRALFPGAAVCYSGRVIIRINVAAKFPPPWIPDPIIHPMASALSIEEKSS
jgi:hypothetical protein